MHPLDGCGGGYGCRNPELPLLGILQKGVLANYAKHERRALVLKSPARPLRMLRELTQRIRYPLVRRVGLGLRPGLR